MKQGWTALLPALPKRRLWQAWQAGRADRSRAMPQAVPMLSQHGPAVGRSAMGQGARQQGFSMIEMMIAVAIGLVVTGAVLYTVGGASTSGRKQDTQARMYDMGQMALNQLTEHARMVGFWMPISEVMAPDALLQDELPLRGCDGGFADTSVAWNALSCAGSTTTGQRVNDALALRFQVQEGGRNWDCVGNEYVSQTMVDNARAKTPAGATAPNFSSYAISDVIEERYFVANAATGNPGLFCRSNGRTEQVADNVEQFRVRYGLSPLNQQANTHNAVFDERSLQGHTGRYASASELASDCSALNPQANSWCSVNAVRICLVLRSDDNVNDQPNTPYVDCDGNVRTQNDRRFRQAFATTVAIRNRISSP